MRPRTILASIILMLACGLMLPAWASAEVVGHITQVEGRVEVLKGGKLPATPVALQDKVESADVLRTKSLSRAQITFIDNSLITLAPESRLAVDEYRFDSSQQKRTAVLNLFQGLAHVVVNKVFKVNEPDFVIKTHTAVTGVRGTDFGIRLQPNASTILNFQGLLQVANISPEVTQPDRRESRAGYIFGPPGSPNTVMVGTDQATTVAGGLPPTKPYAITSEDKKQFDKQMGSGLTSRKSDQGTRSGGSSSGTGTAATGGGTEFMTNLGGPDSGLMTPVASSETTSPSVPLVAAPTGLTTGTGSQQQVVVTPPPVIPPTDNTLSANTTTTQTASVSPPVESPVTPPVTPPVVEPPVTPPVIPPVVEPPVTPPSTPATYTFTQTGYTAWTSTATSTTPIEMTSTGWAERTGSWPEGTFPTYYTSTSTGVRYLMEGAPLGTGTTTGTNTGTLTGTVTGVLGSTLTGPGTYTGINSFGQTSNYTGQVYLYPSGALSFLYGVNYEGFTGTISSATRLLSASGSIQYVPGTYFTQTLDGAMLNTSVSPYNTSSTSTLWGGGYGSEVLGNYAANLTGTNTAPWAYFYDQYSLDYLTGTIRGVLGPLTGGTQSGALTVFPADMDTPRVSSLITPPTPFLFDRWGVNTPIVGSATVTNNQSLTSTIYNTDYQDGRFASGVYNLTQTSQATPVTPVSATYNFAQTYNGMMGVNSGLAGSPSGPFNTYGNGWGQRYATGTANTPGTEYLNGYFNAYNQGTWTLGSGSMPSSPFGYGSTVAVTQMAGSVSGTLGQDLSGNMTFIGSLLNGTSFSYSGPVSIRSSGGTTFSYTGTWANFPNGDGLSSGTASGTIYQWPGYYFTQTMTNDMSAPGNYALNTTGNTGTLSLSGNGGNRSLVYGGSIGGYSGSFDLFSPNGLPTSSSGPLYPETHQFIEGVVNGSKLGAVSGNATLNIYTPALSLSVPGQISLTPSGTSGVAGGSFFTANPGYVANSTGSPLQVNISNQGTLPISTLTQTPLYSFTQTYTGFRISSTLATSTLASVEGYGWGQRIGTAVGGALALPSSYTGYFVAQDLGTRASASPLGINWAGVNGTMTGTLSGVAGQTLSGQMTFNGTSTNGTTFNYSGQATLGTDGRLLYNYYGNWVNGTQTGTGSGNLVQVPGAYFTETVTGGYQQTSTTGTPNTTTVVSTTPLTGTRTVAGSTINTTASEGSGRTSLVNTFPSSSGTTTVNVAGVVAGPTWDTRWGVATMTPTNTPTGSTSPTTTTPVTGVVTIDTANTLTGQFVSQVGNDTIGRNLVSVPTASGLTTSSFTQTATGTITQTPVTGTTGTQAAITTPIPLTGVAAGTMAGPINTNLAITSTALQSSTYNNVLSPQITANTVGALAGPAGGVQTGVATIQAVTTTTGTTGTTSTSNLVGTTTLQPATSTTPTTLTTIVSGVNPAPGGVPAVQTGTVTVTPLQPATSTTPTTLTTIVSGVNPAPGGVSAVPTGTVTVTPKP